MLKMALALTVDSLDSVPETLRGEYTQKDGKFVLNVDGLEDTSGLKSALQKTRAERDEIAKREKAVADKVKRWESLGKSEDEIQAMLTKAAEAEAEIAKKSGNFDALLKQHQENAASILKQKESAWNEEKKALETELGASRASERSAIIETSVMGALTKAKATAEGIDLLTERLGKRIKFETVDGKRKIQIMQADGETPMAGSGPDGVATFDDLVKSEMNKYPSLFEGTGSGGGGKQPGERGGKPGEKTITRAEYDKLTPVEQRQKVHVEKYKLID